MSFHFGSTTLVLALTLLAEFIILIITIPFIKNLRSDDIAPEGIKNVYKDKHQLLIVSMIIIAILLMLDVLGLVNFHFRD